FGPELSAAAVEERGPLAFREAIRGIERNVDSQTEPRCLRAKAGGDAPTLVVTEIRRRIVGAIAEIDRPRIRIGRGREPLGIDACVGNARHFAAETLPIQAMH